MNKTVNRLLGVLMLMLPLYFFSCSDDGDNGPKVLLPKEEGFYVFGENTVAETPSEPAARMALAKLDPTKDPGTLNIDSVYGKYIYIGANGKISFAAVAEDEDGVFLGSNDAAVVDGTEANSVDDDVIHGTLEEDGDPIVVAEEGLYYVFVDMNNLTFVVTRVKGQLIGDALIEKAWSAGTLLAQKSVSPTQTVFEATDVKMQIGGYKYRFNEGWHSFTSEDMSTFSFLGELDYATAWAAQAANPGYFNDNIPCFAKGLYTVTLTFTANPINGEGGSWSATTVKTGEVVTDYSATQVGFFGNAFYLSPGVEGSWGDQGGVKTPTKSGNIYTWTWNDFELIQDREFIVRENGIWNGVLVVWNNSTQTGDAFTSKITKAVEGDNFLVVTGGTYDISLSIDGVTNAKTLTINSN